MGTVAEGISQGKCDTQRVMLGILGPEETWWEEQRAATWAWEHQGTGKWKQQRCLPLGTSVWEYEVKMVSQGSN